LSVGGDILKYAGDAFLAIFRADSVNSMREAMHKAIDSALIIQRNSSNFKTEVGVTLNGELRFLWFLRLQVKSTVKIAISGGSTYFSSVGNELSSSYVAFGDPVWSAKALQENIKGGEILVSSKVW
jgi:adenylate cyclase 10